MGIKVTIKNGMPKIAKGMKKAEDIIAPATAMILSDAKSDVVVVTGKLQSSLRKRILRKGSIAKTSIGSNLDYATKIEDNDGFMSSAVNDNRKQLLNSEVEEINKKINKGRVR